MITFEFDDVSGVQADPVVRHVRRGNDNGFYDARRDARLLRPTPGDETAGASLAEDTYADVAFTRAADGLIAAYTNGAPQFTYPDSNGQSIVGIDGLRFFKDDGATEASAGSVARIRVYDGALTPAEVLDIEQTGGLRSTAAVAGKPTAGPKKKKPKSVSTGISLVVSGGRPSPARSRRRSRRPRRGRRRRSGRWPVSSPPERASCPG